MADKIGTDQEVIGEERDLEIEAMAKILQLLKPLERDVQHRILDWVERRLREDGKS